MEVDQKTVEVIKNTVKGLIADSVIYGCRNDIEDFRVFIDQKASAVAIMFLDGPDKDSWSGHLYELKDDRLEMVEYGAFDFVDMSKWPCFDYEELKIS